MKQLNARVPDSLISLGQEIRDVKDASRVKDIDAKLAQAKVDLWRSLSSIGISQTYNSATGNHDERLGDRPDDRPHRRLLIPTRFMWHTSSEDSKIVTKVVPPESEPRQLMPVTIGNLAVMTVSVFRDRLIDPNDIPRRDLRRYHRGDILTLPLTPAAAGNYDLPDRPFHLFTAFPYFPLSVSEETSRPPLGRFFSEI